MLKSLYNTDHANMRLSNTVVRVNGSPHWVTEVRGDWSALSRNLATWREFIIPDVRDEAVIDVTPVTLGFCQIGERARYLSRVPSRRTKQGLSVESIFAEGGGLPNFSNDRHLSKQLASTINNEYPSFTKALSEIVKGQLVSLCCHKDWALLSRDGSIFIMHKFSGRVGEVVNGKVVLDKKNSYLQENLESDLPEAV